MAGQLTPEEFFAQCISGNRLEVLVHVRRYEDIEELLAENAELRAQVEKLRRDIYQWTAMGGKYMQALDDLRELQRICKKNGIRFDFRSLK